MGDEELSLRCRAAKHWLCDLTPLSSYFSSLLLHVIKIDTVKPLIEF